jgi:hypothetical protein
MKSIKIKAEKLDELAEFIANWAFEKLAAKGIAIAPATVPSVPVEASPGVPVIDCTLAESQSPSVPLDEIEAECQAELAECDANADKAPLRLHGYRLLTQIHFELMDTLNAKHKAEFEEYRSTEDKFIPMSAETDNLIANARAVHSQAPELWEQPLTKSLKRKRADQVAAATYRD